MNLLSFDNRYDLLQELIKLREQRDGLLEACKALLEGVYSLPPLTAIAGVLETQCKIAQSAIARVEEKE